MTTTSIDTLKARLEQTEAELTFFMELGRKLTATLDDAKVLEIIAESVHAYLSPSHTSLYITGNDRRTYELAQTHGYKPGGGKTEPIPIMDGLCGQVLRSGKRLRKSEKELAKLKKWPVDLKMKAPLSDLLCIPILHRKRALAALVISQNADAGRLTDAHLERLERLLEQSRMAVDRALLYRKTADLAITDDLTQLFNHRYIHQALDEHLKRYQEEKKGQLGLIFMDLDNFKAINDSHGHLTGSHALTEVAHVLTDNLRNNDIIARYGGDEFVIILPDTSARVAEEIARRLCKAVGNTTFLTELGGMSLYASFGVALYPDHGVTPRTLVQRSDKAMYYAKGNGGDQAVVYSSKLKSQPLR